MLSNLQNGEIQLKSGIVEQTIKQVIPEELSNLGSVRPLGFDANIIMEVLQNRMYTNKNIAFQELPCNGKDAIVRRIALGYTDFSPEIKVIFNDRDNSITISDNGCGMSEKAVDEIYRFYGRSDKRNSMDEIGMFGLGSKSPFAIADQFTIETESIEDQLRCKYLVTKGGIEKLSRTPSTGNYGTSITFAKSPNTYQNDISFFLTEKFRLWKLAVNLYRVTSEGETRLVENISKQIGTVEDISIQEYPESVIRFETDDYIFLSGPKISGSNMYVGGVPYSIRHFSSYIDDTLNLGYSGNLAIFIKNPNAITISATRENIEKDEKMKLLVADIEAKTKQYIEEQIEKVFRNVDIKNIKNFSDIEFLWNIRTARNMVSERYPEIYEMLSCGMTVCRNNYNRNNTIFDVLKRKEKEGVKVTWKIGEIHNKKSISEGEEVLILDLCKKECISCNNRSEQGYCSIGKEKKHWIMKILPQFVPQKIVTNKNPENFRAMNLKTKRMITFNINGLFADYYFTTEEFTPTNGDVYKISPKKLKELLVVKPGLNVVTKEEYFNIKIGSVVFNPPQGNRITIVEAEQHKLIVQGVSTYGSDSVICKLYSEEALFVKDYISNDLETYLKTKDVKVVTMDEFIKHIKPKLRLKNLSANTVFDLLSRLTGDNMVTTRKGNIITCEIKK